MQARKAARVLPEPVARESSVVRPARMCGQPCSWGSVGVPNFATNHSATMGWAQANDAGRDGIGLFYCQILLSPIFRYATRVGGAVLNNNNNLSMMNMNN